MANDVTKVLSGKPMVTGGVLADMEGSSTPPTDATTALTGFTALGYIGPDGLTETIDRATSKIKAWGGQVVKVVQTDFSVAYSFTFYESANADVLRVVHGTDNVEVTEATVDAGTLTAVKINSEELGKRAWTFEVKDGDGRIRIYLPLGQITEVGEITYSDESVIGYQVTVEAFPDADGNQAYKYIDDGVFAAA